MSKIKNISKKHSISVFFVKIKIYIQLFFMIIINSDFATLVKSISRKKFFISQSKMKQFCVPALNCYSCPSAVSSCPIGALQFWLNDSAANILSNEKISLAGLYILGFLSLFGGIGGRIACGWICPFGFIQDLLNKITRKNIKLHPALKYIKFVVLGLFVLILPLLAVDLALLNPWFCKLICPSGTLLAGIPLLAIDARFRGMIGILFAVKITILVICLLLFLISRRFFCKVLCPLGAIWGLFNKVSLIRMTLDKDRCVNCKKCEDACPMHIEVTKEPNSIECIRCLECVKACPAKCLDINFLIKKDPYNKKNPYI